MLAGHKETLYTNSAMNKLFFMLIELIVLSHLTMKNESVSQKVYLEFGRGIANFSEKSLTVPKGFVILKFEHEHFLYFYCPDGPITQCFVSILLWKPQSVPKLLGHSFWWLWQGTNKDKYFHVWLGLPITIHRGNFWYGDTVLAILYNLYVPICFLHHFSMWIQ